MEKKIAALHLKTLLHLYYIKKHQMQFRQLFIFFVSLADDIQNEFM